MNDKSSNNDQEFKLTDKQNLRQSKTVLIAVFAALIILFALWSGKSTKFEELALGTFTMSVYGTYNGKTVHCHDLSDAHTCLDPSLSRALPKAVLWLGNSQLHGINHAKKGEQPAPGLLAEEWRPHNVDILSFSQPNASFREHYVLFQYLLMQKKKFDVLLLPLVFDDTREGSIRKNIVMALDDPAVRKSLAQTVSGKAILKEVGSAKPETKKSLQDRTEIKITSLLESCCGWTTLRQQARGGIYLKIYHTRNWLFGINASTHRRQLPATYQANIDAVKAILALAKKQNVKVVSYIVPLRNDVPIPYDTTEYTKFKDNISKIIKQSGGEFLNLENLVPGHDWGQEGKDNNKGGEGLDFMHFQHAGHVLLSGAMTKILGKVLK